MALYYQNEQTGAEIRLGRTGTGFYVEAWHPDFLLPLRKTYEWFQQDIAQRDYELLRAVVSAGSRRESALASSGAHQGHTTRYPSRLEDGLHRGRTVGIDDRR